MKEKKWKTYQMTVNGLVQDIRYNEDTVEGLFLPLLHRLSGLHRKKQKRVLALLAAPPATGKSTLLGFLQMLSEQREEVTEIQALGMDGFHYPNSYLETHFTQREGERIPLKSIKGAPETFDVAALREKIRAAREGETGWPVYDRRIHDAIPDGMKAEGKILLIEGNWLLLNAPQWRDLRDLADYTLRIEAGPELLKHRLIRRKVQGGLSQEEAERFYERSDRLNVERLQRESGEADETWTMEEDGDFHQKQG